MLYQIAEEWTESSQGMGNGKLGHISWCACLGKSSVLQPLADSQVKTSQVEGRD